MSLRPRYSLLTLLILTALVAGGVKLWRGPHRVSVSDPSNAFERDLLRWGETFGFSSSEIRYEYDFVRSWSGPQVLSVTGVFTLNYFLIVPRSGPHPNNALGLKYLYSEAEPGKYHFPQLVPASKERIHCLLHSGRGLMNSEHEYFYGVMPVPSDSRMLSSQPPTREEAVPGSELITYVLTDRGKIYQLGGSETGYQGKNVTMEQILDPHLRARIAEEVQKLSTKLN